MTPAKKKILFIHESLRGAGAEKVFIDLINRFDRESHEVTLLLLDDGGTHKASLPEDLRVITLLPEKRSLRTKLKWHFPWPRLKMLSALLQEKVGNEYFDTIVSFMEGPAMRLHSLLFAHARRHITWVHVNLEVNHWSAYMFTSVEEEAALYSRMDAIVFVSKGAREAFHRKFEVYGPQMEVIPNVIDREAILERSREQEIGRQRFTIINVGRLEPQKRQDRLLEAARILKDRGLDFDLWILGTGSLEKRLETLAARLQLLDNVKFLGFQRNPYTYMRAADLFLLTSDTEGWPTVVCESLCLGLPVVSTRVTGADELLDNGAGLLTDMDPAAIADAVLAVAQSPQKQRYMRARADERGRDFNPSTVLYRINSLL